MCVFVSSRLVVCEEMVSLDDGTTSVAADSASAAVAEAGKDPGNDEDHGEDDEDMLQGTGT